MLKSRELVRYAFCGICTTLINIVVFDLLVKMFFVNYMVSNLVAWVVSVLFAFVANKIYVFRSREWAPTLWLKEAGCFFASRVMTGMIDMACMYAMITVFTLNEGISKITVNGIVIILNYIFSKIWVFKKM